jgi:putative YhbY family RNA-binding protein
MPALTLTPAQRSELRSEAHALNPVVIIGAEGLTKAVLAEIDRSLAAHGLIKIRVFGDDREARIELYDTICARLQAAPVQHIGRLISRKTSRRTSVRRARPPSAPARAP